MKATKKQIERMLKNIETTCRMCVYISRLWKDGRNLWKFLERQKELSLKEPSLRKCGMCGLVKPVYAYQERDWEEVEDLVPKRDLLIENDKKPLRPDDVVGIQICESCYKEQQGEVGV